MRKSQVKIIKLFIKGRVGIVPIPFLFSSRADIKAFQKHLEL